MTISSISYAVQIIFGLLQVLFASFFLTPLPDVFICTHDNVVVHWYEGHCLLIMTAPTSASLATHRAAVLLSALLLPTTSYRLSRLERGTGFEPATFSLEG